MKITLRIEETLPGEKVVVVGERTMDHKQTVGAAGKVKFVNLLNELTEKVKAGVSDQMKKRGITAPPKASDLGGQDISQSASAVSNSASPSSTGTERTTSPQSTSNLGCVDTPDMQSAED